MKKIYIPRWLSGLSCTLALLFIASSLPSVSAVGPIDFNVKMSTAGDETYTNTISNVSYFNTDLTFQFVEISDGGGEEYSMNLPAGFVYQSGNTTGNTCANFSTLNASNGNYHFSFNGTAGCVAKTEITYRVTSASTLGNAGIFLLAKSGSSWNIVSDVTLGIASNNSITSALVQDTNSDGYIDAYLLSFATGGVDTNALSGITVAGVSRGGATATGSNWLVHFTDNILSTGNLPQIGGVFDAVTIDNMTISESFQTMNCMASNRIFNAHSYSLPLFNNATTTSVVSSAVAIANGTVTYTQVFSCTMAAVSTSGAESINAPSCNAGYTISGASCIAIPGGGWWGGGGGGGWSPSPDSCPTGDLSGNLYDSKCSVPLTGTGITSSGSTNTGTTITPEATWIPIWSASPSSLSAGTLDTKYFATLTETRNYLLSRITHPGIVKLIHTYGDKLVISDESYFLSVDSSLYHTYNRVINAYVLLFLRVQDAVSGDKSDAVKNDGRLSAGIVISGITLAKNFLDRYIVREYIPEKNITLYRTKNPLLAKPLGILEGKIIAKFDALLGSKSISESEYVASVQAYNDFVLHLMIYRDYGKNLLSKERALIAIKTFMKTYQTPIR